MTSIAPSAYRAPELRLPRLLAGVSYYHPTGLAEHEDLYGPLPLPADAAQHDRAASQIHTAAGCGVLVNLGGDIRVAGDPAADGWRVGIADDLVGPPGRAHAEPSQAVIIRDGGLATSSPRARAWQRGGTQLHHIIAPGTGLPADSCWRTASVAAATCVDANTASTAAILRGERAPQWLDELHLPARLVRHDGTTIIVGGWPAGPAGSGDQA